MDLLLRIRGFTYERQRLGTPAATAAEALDSVVAVYSAHPTAPLALGARTARLTAGQFRSLELTREAVRIPGMRGSLFLATRAAAARVFTPFRITAAQLATPLRRGGMDAAAYAAACARVIAAAGEPRLPRELEEAAGVRGLEMSILLRTLRGEGRLLAVAQGSLRAANLRYVATDRWAPGLLAGTDSRAAADRLAADYLRGYGPARVADFAWWTGLPRGEASRALGTQDTVDVGAGLLIARGDEAALEAARPPRDRVDLLPRWDAYTMGHAPDGRARLVHPDNQGRVYVRKGVVAPGQPNVGLPGDGYPVVLVDGEAVGTWTVTLSGAAHHLFDTVGAATRRRLQERLAAVEALLAG